VCASCALSRIVCSLMRTAAARAPVTAVLCLYCVSACGGSSSTSPSQTCTAITGPTTLRLGAGDVFRLRFRAPSGMTREIVMLSYMGLPERGFSSSKISHRLYDGDRLLGVQDNLTDTVAVWKSPESSFGSPGDTTYGFSTAAASVDFTSIVCSSADVITGEGLGVPRDGCIAPGSYSLAQDVSSGASLYLTSTGSPRDATRTTRSSAVFLAGGVNSREAQCIDGAVLHVVSVPLPPRRSRWPFSRSFAAAFSSSM
jgi:hypothetical protein